MKAFEKFYDYQNEAIAATKGQERGILCLPTGTGKTFLEAGLVAGKIEENPGFNLYVVNAPRILLSFQLCKEIYQFLLQCGKEARYMFVHSGGTPAEAEMEEIRMIERIEESPIPFSQFESGTGKTDIMNMMTKAKRQNLPLILISTYNSCERIEPARKELELGPIKLVINDEAHYLVQEKFFDIIHTLSYEQCFFFTATTKETASPEGRGMQNEAAYGKLLYALEPRKAMDMGRIVKPRIHFITADEKVSSEETRGLTPHIIEQAFAQHISALNKTGKQRKLTRKELNLSEQPLEPKLLIAMQGVADITAFLESNEYEKLREEGVDIFAITSTESVSNNINKEKVKRDEFLKRLKAAGADPKKKLIALHFDILSEGIDISGFTGILILRDLSKIKFVQNYGRIARLHPTDRKNFTDGKIQAWEWEFQMKPFAYILLPEFALYYEDQNVNLKNLTTHMREYGYNFAETMLGDQAIHGEINPEALEALNEIDEKTKQLVLKLENLRAEFEEIEAAALKPEEFQTLARCTALGLKPGTKVEIPEGKGKIINVEKTGINIRLENGKPIFKTIEEILN
jgi:superfamily II DNA or RNA helicase